MAKLKAGKATKIWFFVEDLTIPQHNIHMLMDSFWLLPCRFAIYSGSWVAYQRLHNKGWTWLNNQVTRKTLLNLNIVLATNFGLINRFFLIDVDGDMLTIAIGDSVLGFLFRRLLLFKDNINVWKTAILILVTMLPF